MGKPTSLYRFYEPSGRLLYVGVTSVPRWDGGHRRDKDWWMRVHTAKVEHFDDRETALAAERQAIQSEDPIHNIIHANGRKGSTLITRSDYPWPVQTGDVVCVGVDRDPHAPCGLVGAIHERGFRLTLYNWGIGCFSGSDTWVAWDVVSRLVFAEEMTSEEIAAQGWNDDYVSKMFDMEPLSKFQDHWRYSVEHEPTGTTAE